MKCNNCSNFKRDTRVEAASEITPNVRSMGGTCSVNNKNCMASDKCSCDSFSKK